MRISEWSSDVCSSDLVSASCSILMSERLVGRRKGRPYSPRALCLADLPRYRFSPSPAFGNRTSPMLCRPARNSHIGHASWSERVGQNLLVQVVAVIFTKITNH